VTYSAIGKLSTSRIRGMRRRPAWALMDAPIRKMAPARSRTDIDTALESREGHHRTDPGGCEGREKPPARQRSAEMSTVLPAPSSATPARDVSATWNAVVDVLAPGAAHPARRSC